MADKRVAQDLEKLVQQAQEVRPPYKLEPIDALLQVIYDLRMQNQDLLRRLEDVEERHAQERQHYVGQSLAVMAKAQQIQRPLSPLEAVARGADVTVGEEREREPRAPLSFPIDPVEGMAAARVARGRFRQPEVPAPAATADPAAVAADLLETAKARAAAEAEAADLVTAAAAGGAAATMGAFPVE